MSSSNRVQLDWTNVLFVGGYHIALIIALPLYLSAYTPSALLLGLTGILLLLSGLSITAGYHRLFSHRTYKAHPMVEWVLLFFGSLATQGSVLRWSHDHRLHHRYVDTELDPYGTHKGFWHSHLLWMFKKRPPMEERYIRDLKERPVIMHQHRHYALWMAVSNLGTTLLIGWITGEMVGAFVIAFLLRLFITHHSTWFINSLAHMWGSRPYSTEHSAVNNFILAFLTYGEGYHNFHHTFAGDYRNGIRWYQFDPSKYLIWLLNKLGLASDLKRTDPLMIQRKLVQADKRLLIEHLNHVEKIDTRPLIETVEKLSEKLSRTVSEARKTFREYQARKQSQYRDDVKELKARYRAIRKELRQDLRAWRRLCHLVFELEPATAPVHHH